MWQWLAASAAALGAGAAVLDLGGRLFGSYRRSLRAVAWRMLVLATAAGLLLAPLWLLLAGCPGAGVWAWVAAPLGAAAVVGLVRPARRGVGRMAEPAWVETEEPLAPGVRLVRSELAVDSLPQQPSGLRLLVLSELHCNTRRGLDALGQCVDAVAARQPDLVLILGDLGGKADLLPGVVARLAAVPARIGSFCVRGNHDFEGGRAALIAELLADTPIHLLDNRAWTGDGVALTGIEAPWNGAELTEKFGNDFTIALSHTPDNLFAFERLGIDLVVSGHTHGGHLRIPGLGPLLVPSGYGTLLARGAFCLRRTTLYVTPGLG
jgi:predicted MPP superfamily phosphohydrolase